MALAIRIVRACVPAILIGSLLGCVEKIPEDLVQTIEDLDRKLIEVQGAAYAPDAYYRFVKHWVAVKGRLDAGEDEIHWPWEENRLLAELQQISAEGEDAVAQSEHRRDAQRDETYDRLTALEGRLQVFRARIDQMGSRIVLGRKPIETALLLHQARSFYDQGLYGRSTQAAQLAQKLMESQAAVLNSQFGHYADERRVNGWRRLVQRAVEWSKTNHAAAIVVSKADRRLIVYRNGRPVLSYPVRLGYNGMLEKRYQGDGATPEGLYHVIRKRDRGQTLFYKALLLDYPNPEDRRRFQQAIKTGRVPKDAFIGGQIEIHGSGDDLLSQTLGCVQVENHHMDALFNAVEAGTPVTIVGALNLSNTVALALAGLDEAEEG
jgi:L,D-peptidoglycan transpeptidase YkuD (ErfK/YbiS/YcfS/YnhG family)